MDDTVRKFGLVDGIVVCIYKWINTDELCDAHHHGGTDYRRRVASGKAWPRTVISYRDKMNEGPPETAEERRGGATCYNWNHTNSTSEPGEGDVMWLKQGMTLELCVFSAYDLCQGAGVSGWEEEHTHATVISTEIPNGFSQGHFHSEHVIAYDEVVFDIDQDRYCPTIITSCLEPGCNCANSRYKCKIVWEEVLCVYTGAHWGIMGAISMIHIPMFKNEEEDDEMFTAVWDGATIVPEWVNAATTSDTSQDGSESGPDAPEVPEVEERRQERAS
jgi:hypothetical protein